MSRRPWERRGEALLGAWRQQKGVQLQLADLSGVLSVI